jgi:hypothetical protein
VGGRSGALRDGCRAVGLVPGTQRPGLAMEWNWNLSIGFTRCGAPQDGPRRLRCPRGCP